MSDWWIMAYPIVLPIGYEDPIAIPSGWEPIGTLARQGNNAVVLCRRGDPPPAGGGLVIDHLTPDTHTAGTPPITVDLYGSGFDPTCAVTANDLARDTSYLSDTHLQYTARPDQANPGDVMNIRVANSADQVSNTIEFVYTAPTITTISPNNPAGAASAGPYTVTGVGLDSAIINYSTAMFLDKDQNSTPATITNNTPTGFTASTTSGSPLTPGQSPWVVYLMDTNYGLAAQSPPITVT